MGFIDWSGIIPSKAASIKESQADGSSSSNDTPKSGDWWLISSILGIVDD